MKESPNVLQTLDSPRNVLVAGGAGYVGSKLVPKLLDAGHKVSVLDLYIFGRDIFKKYRGSYNLQEIKGDVRNIEIVRRSLRGIDSVIYLACISNDPSFELDPDLGKSINFNAFRPFIRAAKDAGVRRFIFASSSSVYGIQKNDQVTENLPLFPLTDYSTYKARCEELLDDEREPGFTTVTIRPATVCGYAPRLRLDVIVNILTNHAVTNGVIKVFGGQQKRPNIHIDDMAEIYVQSLGWPDPLIDGEVFNAGYDNQRIRDLAGNVKKVIGSNIEIETTPTKDNRSYHISSEKLKNSTGFRPKHSVQEAIRELADALRSGRVPDSMTNPCYYNIKTMRNLVLK